MHSHEWTVVEIGNEPIGASCECGQHRGFEPPPGPLPNHMPVAQLDIGTIVSLGLQTSGQRLYGVTHLSYDTRSDGTLDSAAVELRQVVSPREDLRYLNSFNGVPDPN